MIFTMDASHMAPAAFYDRFSRACAND